MPTIYAPGAGSQTPTQAKITAACTAGNIAATSAALRAKGVASYQHYKVGDIARYALGGGALANPQLAEWNTYIGHMKKHGGECYGVIKAVVQAALNGATPVQWKFSLSADSGWHATADLTTKPVTIDVQGPAIPPV